MKKIVMDENGGPEVLHVVDAGHLQPKPGTLLVRVEATGVNFLDVYQRKGIYEMPKPFTPGLEGAGEVVALGAGTEGFALGDRVAWINVPSSYASQIVVPVAKVVKLPEHFPSSQGLLFQAVTAQYLVAEYGNLKPGKTVLVHAAAGGVGQLLVQWLKHLGTEVIATASAADKLETVRALGADHLINYKEEDFVAKIMEITGGRGVDVAYDSVGKVTLSKTIDALTVRGSAVTFGFASGPAEPIEPSKLVDPAKRLEGASIMSYIADDMELQQRLKAVLNGMEQGWLKLGGGKAYALADAAQAHRDLEARGTQGKLYLVP